MRYLIHDWVINDSNGGNFPNGEANRDAHKGETASSENADKLDMKRGKRMCSEGPYHANIKSIATLPMDEIGGAIEGIDDPGRFVCEVGGGAERRGRLLPDELVVRKVLPEVVEDEVLAGLVRLRHQIHLHRRAMSSTVSPNPNPIGASTSTSTTWGTKQIIRSMRGRQGEEQEFMIPGPCAPHSWSGKIPCG